MEVIGVVKDIKYTGIRDEVPPQAFMPFQALTSNIGEMTIYARTKLEPNQFFALMRSKVQSSGCQCPGIRDAHHGKADRKLAADPSA